MRTLFLLLTLSAGLMANEIYIASGAGYKRAVSELSTVFEQKTQIEVNQIYGNMQQISEQIKYSDKIAVFVGDEDFIRKLKIEYSQKIELGMGSLVLVFSKHHQNVSGIEALPLETIKKIGLPDTKKTIYGKAADEFLNHANLRDTLKNKLTIFQAAPQVSSYLISGDLDAGFINKTDYLGIKQNVGKMIEIDKNLYSPIKIIGVVLSGRQSPQTDSLVEFLSSDEARNILNKHGL
ncbi:MAG: molybdate ABC transporter substrate-binding protein [Sulfurovum sp.]|jgi:molybdate transport system substrate-binding protein|nr:molybdate ABC transporter substrate-binding protein [Sulfurovum sp.]MDD2400444.1 molybdate ABC transporter substrate-binding protein [Sulfurovum sp.]MDD3601906.1 molybdate ABC transporter substrate-binding protein [Sulfurovum sp.]